jgi:hypothetical protein
MAMVEFDPIAADPQKARAFVLAHGGPRESARLEGIFGATGPAREVVRELEGLQNPDGGFPAGNGGPSSVDATCYTLYQLKEMPPLAGSPMASRAVAFLRRCQQTDGSWRESEEAVAAGVGPWARPSSPSAAPYLTANAAYTILTLEPEHLDPVYRAGNWLRLALSSAEGASVPVQTLGLAWALFYRLHGPTSHEAGWCFATAMKREMAAYKLAWFLACGLEVSAGGKFLLPVVQALGKLGSLQQEDGSWPAEPGFALESTLTALRVLRGYGVV